MASAPQQDDTKKKLLVVVVGATGNQGGSVARRFLQDPRYAVRGLTRDPSSAAAKELAALGAEMVGADLDDVESLKSAFRGANLIFSVTNYWEPFFRPDCRAKAQELGVTCRKYAYDVEYAQGKNIVDAAAAVAVDSLVDNGFLVSTLSHAGKCSKGRFKDLYHFDAKADVFPDYVAAAHPRLAAKMSCVQTGFFTTSHRILPESYFQKVGDISLLPFDLNFIFTLQCFYIAPRRHLRDALPLLAGQANPAPRRQPRHGALRVCRRPDAPRQALHGRRRVPHLARVCRRLGSLDRRHRQVQAGVVRRDGGRHGGQGLRDRGGLDV
jgi:hypothetical protein